MTIPFNGRLKYETTELFSPENKGTPEDGRI
jgi:hypothetical protein